MIQIDDLQVNKADDIVLINEDIHLEPVKMKSTFKNGKRRLSARVDDILSSPEICAGIESFLHSYITDITLSEIEQNIRIALTRNNLFNNSEIQLYFDQSNSNKLGIIVSYNIAGIPEENNEDIIFSVYMDIQNLRNYS